MCHVRQHDLKWRIDVQMNQQSSVPVTFHISPLRLWGVPVLLVAFALFMVGLSLFAKSLPPGEQAGLIAGAGVLCCCAVGIWLLMYPARLIVGDTEIIHCQFGYKIRSNWSNVISVVEESGSIYLELKESGGGNILLRTSNQILPKGLNPVARPDLLAEGRFIDITPFRYYWRNGRLKQLILSHLKDEV